MHKLNEYSIPESEPCIFVQGPSRDRAEFYGKWLCAAAKADAVWQKVKAEPRYGTQLERVPNDYIPAFGRTAIWLVSQLANDSYSAIVGLGNKEEEIRGWFLTMRHLNFFSYPDKHYEMTIPHQLSMGGVKNAVLVGVVKMKDEKLYLRSEYSSPTMSFAEAKAWQQRLCEMRANYCGTESGMQTFH